MPAKIVIQNREIKDLFYRRIVESNDRGQVSQPCQKDLEIQHRKQIQGFHGKLSVKTALFFYLSSNHILMNDIVLEVNPNDFIQIDHLVLSSKGIFVIETKAWNGEFDLFTIGWKQKGDCKTLDCSTNSIDENVRHVNLLKTWLKDNLNELEYQKTEKFVCPMLVLKKGIVRINECDPTMIIQDSGIAAATHINNTLGENIPIDLISKIIGLIKHSKPLEHWTWMHNHYDFEDIRTITINGSLGVAEEVRQIYKKKGYEVSPFNEKNDDNTYQFTIENHLEKEFALKINSVDHSNNERVLIKEHKSLFPIILRRTVVLGMILFALLYGIDKINDLIKTEHAKNYFTSQAEPFHEIYPGMEFIVDTKHTNISLEDGNSTLMSDIYIKGTVIHFYEDKIVKIYFPDKSEKIIHFEDDIVKVEVGNSYTSVYHLNKKQKHQKYFKYNFITNEIVE
ncbi:nuclease-related domain-containing protein [Geosporobacter ferrireducens]|uniref:NERD domain-containing protein n=1 Tax=Geosporobacter ferrireducens TaxID=1424294 RepID=A0A1D8GJZ9_9FIRM|nr:nuclease-related domain-containing protein [Geosporobacter ferrireducens]AOT71235.1 hypothetical protein Gferi_17755 [Geosporobacter ferrireducens]